MKRAFLLAPPPAPPPVGKAAHSCAEPGRLRRCPEVEGAKYPPDVLWTVR